MSLISKISMAKKVWEPFLLLLRGNWRLHLWPVWSLYWKITLIFAHFERQRPPVCRIYVHPNTIFIVLCMQNLIFKPEDVLCCTEFLSCRNLNSLDYTSFLLFPSHYIFVKTSYIFLQPLDPPMNISLQRLAIISGCWETYFPGIFNQYFSYSLKLGVF